MTTSEPRFKVVDRAEPKSTTIAGVTYVGNPDREIVRDLGYIEPSDVRADEFVSIPLRSSLQYGGPGFEIGPYDLDTKDCVDLYNALADHLNRFGMAKVVTA